MEKSQQQDSGRLEPKNLKKIVIDGVLEQFCLLSLSITILKEEKFIEKSELRFAPDNVSAFYSWS